MNHERAASHKRSDTEGTSSPCPQISGSDRAPLIVGSSGYTPSGAGKAHLEFPDRGSFAGTCRRTRVLLLFAIFPALFCASSIFGLAARSAHQIYGRLLDYLALVIPKVALGTVLETFNQITATATTGKVTFGLIGALWSASAGISAIQDTLSDVYKIQDTRSFLKARLDAIGLTMILSVVVTLILASLFGESMVARILHQRIQFPLLAGIAAVAAKILGWSVAIALLALSFSLINYWAPDVKSRRWRFLTPGAAFGILGWLLTSLAFRVYLQYFNTFPVTYGSLGAVMILLTWFYLTGLMILLGAVIDSEIEAAATKMRVAGSQTSSAEAQTISGDSQKSQERS